SQRLRDPSTHVRQLGNSASKTNTSIPPAIAPNIYFFSLAADDKDPLLSLHDALPIYTIRAYTLLGRALARSGRAEEAAAAYRERSEEHTSELQSPDHLVCRLLLEKQKAAFSSGKVTINHVTNIINNDSVRTKDVKDRQ